MSNFSFWICSPRNNSHHHARIWEELYWNLTYFDYESIVRRTSCRRPCAYLQVGTVSISLWGCKFSGNLIINISTTVPSPTLCRYSSNSLWMFHPFETVVLGPAHFLVSHYNFIGQSQRVVRKHHGNHVNQPTTMKTNKKNYCLVPPYKSGRVKWVATKHHEKPKTTETNHQLWKSITKILSCPPVQVYRRESANIGHHWGFRLLTMVNRLVGWGHHISISRNQHYAFLDLETNKLLVTMVLDTTSDNLICVKV